MDLILIGLQVLPPDTLGQTPAGYPENALSLRLVNALGLIIVAI